MHQIVDLGYEGHRKIQSTIIWITISLAEMQFSFCVQEKYHRYKCLLPQQLQERYFV